MRLIPSSGNMGPESVICCSQARILEVELEHQPKFNTYSQPALTARNTVAKVAQSLWQWPSNDFFNLRPTTQETYAQHYLESRWVRDLGQN